MSFSISVTIFWLYIVEVDGSDIVEGLGRVDLGKVNNSEMVKGRGKDKDGCHLFLFWFWDQHCLWFWYSVIL